MLTKKASSPASSLPPDRRKPVSSAARAVGSYVPKLSAKAFEKYGFHSAEIMAEWPRVAGVDLAAFTQPERIKWPRTQPDSTSGAVEPGGGATLILRVEAARALDVQYRTPEIIDRINRYFGYRAIGALKIVQNPVTAKPAVPQVAKALKPVAEPPAILNETEPALRDALTGLWTAIARDRTRR